MKLFYAIIISIFMQSCSFDNKTGIWKNENSTSKNNKDLFKEFKTLSSSNEFFNKIIPLKKNFKFILNKPLDNMEWQDIFYNQTNNFDNFTYNDLNQLIFKSKKLTNHKVNNFILLEENNLIINDHKGNIIVFSINENKLISKFNFYKKKYKKINKKLNLIVENNVIYVSDNIGYIYAFNYKKKKVIWAKNFKIPFRSNLKIAGNSLFASNQNNSLFFINKNTGDELSEIPTEETFVKNKFINNLSLNKNSIFFLNTYGSLYSFDIKTSRMNWFINLNQSLNLNPSNLFFGNQIISNKDKIVVSSNQFTYIIDTNTGAILHKINISSIVKPIILNEYLFLTTKNGLLIALSLNNGKILYSYDVNKKISEYLDIKKKKTEFKSISIVNSNIFIFLKNSYLLKFNINGKLDDVRKLPSKINTHNIFIDGSILYLDNKNRLLIVD